jgi:hypothetical protein
MWMNADQPALTYSMRLCLRFYGVAKHLRTHDKITFHLKSDRQLSMLSAMDRIWPLRHCPIEPILPPLPMKFNEVEQTAPDSKFRHLCRAVFNPKSSA